LKREIATEIGRRKRGREPCYRISKGRRGKGLKRQGKGEIEGHRGSPPHLPAHTEEVCSELKIANGLKNGR